jgi:hypothetical protein
LSCDIFWGSLTERKEGIYYPKENYWINGMGKKTLSKELYEVKR